VTIVLHFDAGVVPGVVGFVVVTVVVDSVVVVTPGVVVGVCVVVVVQLRTGTQTLFSLSRL